MPDPRRLTEMPEINARHVRPADRSGLGVSSLLDLPGGCSSRRPGLLGGE